MTFEDILNGTTPERDPDMAELVRKLELMAAYNNFAASLVLQHRRGRELTEKQVAAAKNMLDKIAKTNAQKAAAEKIMAKVDLSPIEAAFAAAMAKGLSSPVLRAEGLNIKLSWDSNPQKQSLHVSNRRGRTAGRIEGGRLVRPTAEALEPDFASYTFKNDWSEVTVERTAIDALALIAKDPGAAAVRHGKVTGRCSCCGKELTNDESIKLGIGPICRSKWSF